MKLHKEGTQTLLLGAVVLAGLPMAIHHYFGVGYLYFGITGLCGLVYLLLLNFFRIPEKKLVLDDGKIVAPCDGKVVVIEEVYEPEFLNENRRQISIFMSPLNVHNNVNAVSGVVSYFKYHPGKYLVAWHPKSSTENERHSVVIQNERITILVKQIAGALARRIVNYMQPGMKAEQGGELGFIKFGSRVDLLLPPGTEITVQLNEKVKAGITVLAKY